MYYHGAHAVSQQSKRDGALARYSSFDTNLDVSSMQNMFSSRNTPFELI
jgi:hypothetical protein